MLDDSVRTVSYIDSGAFSVKLTEKEGSADDDIRDLKQRQQAFYSSDYGLVQRTTAYEYRNALTNYYNLQFTGPLYMGSKKEAVDVVYDTGVTNTMVSILTCTSGCLGTKFDNTASTTYAAIETETNELTFTSAFKVTVSLVQDQVCLGFSDTTCVKDFKWNAITKATGMPIYQDGSLGLASNNSNDEQWGTSHLYVDYLKNSGVITERRFSFFMENYSGTSFVDFGKKDPAAVKTGMTMVSIPISNDDYYGYFWSADVDAFRFPDGASPKNIFSF